jgi:CheY-like chemotaxis protein
MTKPLALVVEDEKGLRAIYRHILGNMDYDILEAPDGDTAIALLQEHIPNIVFLDIRLPHTNGLAVIDYVRQSAHLQNLYVVVVTSSREMEIELVGQTEFILKPVKPDQIREHAAKVLNY